MRLCAITSSVISICFCVRASAGFEVASERVSWQIASFGEEIGGDIVSGVETPSREDRRLNMKITARF